MGWVRILLKCAQDLLSCVDTLGVCSESAEWCNWCPVHTKALLQTRNIPRDLPEIIFWEILRLVLNGFILGLYDKKKNLREKAYNGRSRTTLCSKRTCITWVNALNIQWTSFTAKSEFHVMNTEHGLVLHLDSLICWPQNMILVLTMYLKILRTRDKASLDWCG